MSDETSTKTGARVTVDHSMRVLDALEWSTETSGAPLVVSASELSTDLIGPLAERVMQRHRVIGIKPESHWDPITTSWWAGEPIVLLAQGEAGRLACLAAKAAPGSVRALILADYVPGPGSTEHHGIVVPTLVFHGRQSDVETHAQAVQLHEEIPGSHLIEPEDCGPEPTRTCVEPLATSIEWYLGSLGQPYMEFETGSEPVDPRG